MNSNSRPGRFDVVFVGAGHNALVAAAYLAKAGRSVVLLERGAVPGGFVRTEELTTPGFWHDRFSSTHPSFVSGPAFAELGAELAELGLRYVQTEVATGASLPDGRSAVISTRDDDLAAELDRLGEGVAWQKLSEDLGPNLGTLFSLMGMDLTTPEAGRVLDKARTEGVTAAVPFQQLLTGTAYDLITDRFRSEALRSVLLPWTVHGGPGPHDAGGALWAAVYFASVGKGFPAPVGGSGKLAEALTALVERHGGLVVTGAEVDEIVVEAGRATGVRTTDGEHYRATQAVVATTLPGQLYGRLLRDAPNIPAGVRDQAARHRFRRGCFQLNLALSGKPHFAADARLDGTLVNIGRGIEEMVAAVRQAEAGLLPAHPTIAWHDPTVADPGRAPAGAAVVRIQTLTTPLQPTGDAAGEVAVDGGWTPAVKERYADRVLAEVAQHVPGLQDLILARHVFSPVDLAAENPNAGPGDVNAGHNDLSQGFTQRPIPAHRGGYAAVVPRLYLIGAAAWPGPGVSGASGRAIARALLAGTPD